MNALSDEWPALLPGALCVLGQAPGSSDLVPPGLRARLRLPLVVPSLCSFRVYVLWRGEPQRVWG